MKVVNIAEKRLAEAKTHMAKQNKAIEASKAQMQRMNETIKREKIITDLVEPLNKANKQVMLDLLESVQTGRLKSAFDKYLPTVLEEKVNTTTQKATLTEGKEITGNKKTQQSTGARDNVIDIRRLAGLN